MLCVSFSREIFVYFGKIFIILFFFWFRDDERRDEPMSRFMFLNKSETNFVFHIFSVWFNELRSLPKLIKMFFMWVKAFLSLCLMISLT